LKIHRVPAFREPHFPADQYTDQPERFLAAELIREKAMAGTFHEVPHAVAVLVDAFEETEQADSHSRDDLCRAGRAEGNPDWPGGSIAQKIGTDARKELEEILWHEDFFGVVRESPARLARQSALVRQLDWHLQLERLTGE